MAAVRLLASITAAALGDAPLIERFRFERGARRHVFYRLVQVFVLTTPLGSRTFLPLSRSKPDVTSPADGQSMVNAEL